MNTSFAMQPRPLKSTIRVKRFSLIITVLAVIAATIFGVAANQRAHAAAICTPATSISVPFTKDGAGDFCYVATSLCTSINSWNLATLEVNGTSYLNTWVSGPTIAPMNGTFTIHYVSTVAFGHFEINAPCSSATNTPVGPTNTPTRTFTPFVITNTPTRTITPTALSGSFPDLIIYSVVSSPPGWLGGCATTLTSGIRVTVLNNGTANAGAFVVDANGAQQTVSGGLAVGTTVNLWFTGNGNFTVTADATGMVTESDEGNNTRSYTAITGTPPVLCTRTPTPTGSVTTVITNTPTRTPTFDITITLTFTRTPTATTGPSLTPTRTPTAGFTPTRTRTPTVTSLPPITNTPTRTPTATSLPAITNTPTAITTSCGSLAICDGFESQTLGAAPSGSWQMIYPDCQGTGTAIVDSTQFHTGTRSIKVDGKTGYCNHVFFGNTTNVAAIGPVVYVRLFVRPSTALGTDHIAFIAMKDTVEAKNLRFGGQGQVMAWNRESDDATVPSMSPVGISTSVGLPINQWSCLELKVDGTNGFLQAWLNGTNIAGLTVDGVATADIDQAWIASKPSWHPSLSDIKFGWESYSSGDNVLWFDDVALGSSRIGCGT